MDEDAPPHCAPKGDDEEDPKKEPFTDEGDSYGGDDDPRQWRRRRKAQQRVRLKANVDAIIRELRTPLRDIVRDHVLPRLPVQTLLRFSPVSADWRRLVSVPLFRHTQSHTHRSASGVFRHVIPGVLAYSPFDPLAGGVPDPSLSFLPGHPGVAALASSNGLLCCAGVVHSYYVCNPSTAEWTPLPEPSLLRLASQQGFPVVDNDQTVVALVFGPSADNLAADYHLVRAFKVPGDFEGVYGFQVFSSDAGVWRNSSDLCFTESLVHGSGVSAGGVAYWRTTMQTVLAYDPKADRCWSRPWPMGYDTTAQWQLGEIGGRLCCTCVTDSAVKIYALAAGDYWSLLTSYLIVEVGDGDGDGEGFGGSPPVFRGRPWPLRFQSEDPEVLLWMAGRVVGLDVAGGRVRETCVAAEEPWMNPYAHYVPHISTFARVFPKVDPWRDGDGDGDGDSDSGGLGKED